MVTCSLGWLSWAGYSEAGLGGGAFLSAAWAEERHARASAAATAAGATTRFVMVVRRLVMGRMEGSRYGFMPG